MAQIESLNHWIIGPLFLPEAPARDQDPFPQSGIGMTNVCGDYGSLGTENREPNWELATGNCLRR